MTYRFKRGEGCGDAFLVPHDPRDPLFHPTNLLVMSCDVLSFSAWIQPPPGPAHYAPLGFVRPECSPRCSWCRFGSTNLQVKRPKQGEWQQERKTEKKKDEHG